MSDVTHPRQNIVCGFTQQQLKAAFEKVEDPANWKNPINASVKQADLAITMLAVEFFTATKVEIVQLMSNGSVVIHAPGYYAGPAN